MNHSALSTRVDGTLSGMPPPEKLQLRTLWILGRDRLNRRFQEALLGFYTFPDHKSSKVCFEAHLTLIAPDF